MPWALDALSSFPRLVFISPQHPGRQQSSSPHMAAHAFNASTSSCSNGDIVIRGDIVEFLNRQRCGSCQSRGRDCLIKRGQDACLLCSDAGRPCTFDRLVRVQGPVSIFTWDSLLGKESLAVAHASSSINNPYVFVLLHQAISSSF